MHKRDCIKQNRSTTDSQFNEAGVPVDWTIVKSEQYAARLKTGAL